MALAPPVDQRRTYRSAANRGALPPIGEQQRVVSKAHELMALCNRLKVDIADLRNHQARLATSLIESALEAA